MATNGSPRRMDVLRSAVWNRRIQPVTAPPENASYRKVPQHDLRIGPRGVLVGKYLPRHK